VITIGQTAFRDNRAFFDVWTSFESRSFRNGVHAPPQPELKPPISHRSHPG
jgi:hypothetical protein